MCRLRSIIALSLCILALSFGIRTAAHAATSSPRAEAGVARTSPPLREKIKGLKLHCRWADPVSGNALAVSFPGHALIACARQGIVRITATLHGHATRLTVQSIRSPEQIIISRQAKPLAELRLQAPDSPTSYVVSLLVRTAKETRTVTLTLVTPYRSRLSGNASGEMIVNGHRLGSYRAASKSGVEKVRTHPLRYTPPDYFLRITPTSGDLFVSPTMRLHDLVVPTESTGKRHTRYVPVNYPLLAAIESLRAALVAKGIPASALYFLSIFRTPSYNRSIGSGSYSRHKYGDAIDFLIDRDGDKIMDDLNGDGRVNQQDGLWLVAVLEDLQANETVAVGGIGVYSFARKKHKVTMHLDLRGHRARWGYHYSANGRKREFSWKSRRFAAPDEAERIRREQKRNAATQ